MKPSVPTPNQALNLLLLVGGLGFRVSKEGGTYCIGADIGIAFPYSRRRTVSEPLHMQSSAEVDF